MGGTEKGGRKVLNAAQLADQYESMATGYTGEAPVSYVRGFRTKANTLRELLVSDPVAAEEMAAELQKPRDETRDAVRKVSE
jgi:hypothetical protein